mgnify:FL=1
MDRKDSQKVDGVKLIRIIANRNIDEEAARKAFYLFVSYFEIKIKKRVEILALKYGYNENVAFEAIRCAFNKVWLYPTFDMGKSSCTNEENAIIIWLVKIAFSQMCQFTRTGECARISEEEDLSVIENTEDFVDSFQVAGLDPLEKMQLIEIMEKKLSLLDEKHRIIYLTYKAYQRSGKKLPRKLLEMLRKRLGLSQSAIRVYKKQACEAINDLKLLEA